MSHPTILDILRHRAVELSDREAFTFLSGGQEVSRLTFSQLNGTAREIGARLQRLGLAHERALLLYPPGLDYISAFYGCLSASVIAVPAYPPRMNRNLGRLEAIIEDAQPKVAMTTKAVFSQLQDKLSESPGLARLSWIVTDESLECVGEDWVAPGLDGDSLAFLQYTSASTAKPKGVMVSHRNILHNESLMKEALGHSRDTIMVSWLPLFHDMGLISAVLGAVFNGFQCYLLSPVEFLKRPSAWLEGITRYRGTFSGGPDFAYQLCVDRITAEERKRLDLSSWQAAFDGSEPVRVDTLERFAATFRECGFNRKSFFPCYGLAENTLMATGGFFTSAQSFSRRSLERNSARRSKTGKQAVLVSCGSPPTGSRLCIADSDTGRRLSDGQIGEIWLASPSVAMGYWNQPEATAANFGAKLDDGDGPFLRTGDLGFVYGGDLYITGRLKDLIIIRGRNLIPQDIEQTVERCDVALRPAFAAAFSVDVAGAERLVVAAEVRREARHDLDYSALVEHIRTAVVRDYEVDVSAIALLRPAALAKTSSGKTQRVKVRQEFLPRELTLLFEWRDPAVFGRTGKPPARTAGWGAERLEKLLVELIAKKTKLASTRIDRDSPLLSYGLDSMLAAALVCDVEKAVEVDLDLERLFEGEPSVRQLARRILDIREVAHTACASIKARCAAAPTVSQPITMFGSRSDSHPDAEPTSGVSAESLQRNGHPSTPPLRSTSPEVTPDHPFCANVNPELGRALGQLGLDKSFVRGEGSWLWDASGRRYLDFLAQYGALPFGFNPPRIWKALNDVRESGEPSFVQPSFLDAAGALARRLLAAAPRGLAYVTFANSGAEAIEAAIKLCRSTTRRLGILSASSGFHGKTLGALSATHKKKYQRPFGAPVAEFDCVPFGDINELRRALSSRRYAGFLVEPLQGEGGIVEAPAGYLRLARKACREFGTLFVADEIQTGLGRTGAMFVCGELGITPDVMTVAKALGGGLVPIGACLAAAEAYNDDFALHHTSTFAGNTLACRAGLATLEALEENEHELIARVAANGERLKRALIDLQKRFPGIIAEVRGRGYLLGLRFGLHRYSVEHGMLGYLGEQDFFTAVVVSYLLNSEGVRVGYTLNDGGVLRIEPPLTATWEECEYFLRAMERVLLRIEERDLAVLTFPITGFRAPDTPPAARPAPLPDSNARRKQLHHEPRKGDARFAFLVHPLAWRDYADVDPTLSKLADDQIAKLSASLADNFDPFVIGETRIESRSGKTAYGEFILVPQRAQELQRLSRAEAVSQIGDAVRIARDRGAGIVGLGAYTSVVTQGGLLLKAPGRPALTTGNSYTAMASWLTVLRAADARGLNLVGRTVAIIGAGGAVGQALSILLSRNAGRLLLVGNPAHPEESLQRLTQVAGRIKANVSRFRDSAARGSVAQQIAGSEEHSARRDGNARPRPGERVGGPIDVSVDAREATKEADIVVCCTSSAERLIHDHWLRPSAILCDVSRPPNVGPEIALRRPDVLALEGAVVRMPGDSHLSFNCSLPSGHIYACMAETMMLSLEHRHQDASLGFDLQIEQVLEMERLANEHGFQVVLEQKRIKEVGQLDTKEQAPRTIAASALGSAGIYS